MTSKYYHQYYEADIQKVNRLSDKERNIFNKLILRRGLQKI